MPVWPPATGCALTGGFLGMGSDITPADRIMDVPAFAHASASGLLKEEGISVARPELLDPLHSEKPKVRALVAWQLADEISDALKRGD
jgi:hypothetical protein